MNQHAADNDIQDIHPAVDQQRNFGVARPRSAPLPISANGRRRIA